MPRSSFSELDGEMFFSFFGIHPKQQQPASWNSYILSYYSYILSYSQFIHTPWNRQLHHCVSGLNLHTIILKIYLANRNLKTCQFLQLDAIKKWNAATLSTLSFNTGFTSIVCNWKKVQCHKLVEDNETVDLQIKFQRLGLFSWVTLKVQICRLSVSEQNIKLKTKQYLHLTLIL